MKLPLRQDSINAAIKALQSFEESQGPNTINVSGACHENILIKNMDRLTLNAVNGASITDASNGNSDVIAVDNSLGFTLTGFTITGGVDAVDCEYGSHDDTATLDSDVLVRLKLDYERYCYQQAEAEVRDRLRQLQMRVSGLHELQPIRPPRRVDQ